MLIPACPLISCCYTTFGRCFVAAEVSNNLNHINGLGFPGRAGGYPPGPPHRPGREQVTQPVPRASESQHDSGASLCYPAWPIRCCGRFWVWAEHRSLAAAGTSPSQSHACCCDGSASIATPSPPTDVPPLAGGSCLGCHNTENARATSGRASGAGISRARVDSRDTTATTPSSCGGDAFWLSDV